MTDAVVEISGTHVTVTLFPTVEAAEKHAIAIAVENTDATEAEVLEHLQQLGWHAQGDWAVHMVTAQEADEAEDNEAFARQILGT